MRPDRLIAIATRDLRIEFGGRRGWLLPLVATFILGPMASAPVMPEKPLQLGELLVGGDVPQAVRDLPRIQQDDERALLRFEQPSEANGGVWVLRGDSVPVEVREAMAGLAPGITTEVIAAREPVFPNRSLFLALIAASVLTGSISQSIPGERTAHTLESLLTAGITRYELVVGKWLAWGGFGAIAGLISAAVTVALGRQQAGWWLLPLPVVSLGTVALGFFLVRRANDVVGGATVAIRVLPAALTVTGLAAWYLGSFHPLYGAIIPIGGALVAAGDTWPGALPPLLATASTLTMSAAALAITARDMLEGERAIDDRGLRGSLTTASLAWVGWWGALLGSLVWTAGGNSDVAHSLRATSGPLAATAALALLVLLKLGRSMNPTEAFAAHPPPPLAWARAAVAGLALAIAAPLAVYMPPVDAPLLLEARHRLADALNPSWTGPALFFASVSAQELLFRGWMRRHSSDAVQIVCFVAIFSPFNPVHGLAVAGLLTALTRSAGGSVWPAIAARLLWGALPPRLDTYPPLALLLALGFVLIWWNVDRAEPEPTPVPA